MNGIGIRAKTAQKAVAIKLRASDHPVGWESRAGISARLQFIK